MIKQRRESREDKLIWTFLISSLFYKLTVIERERERIGKILIYIYNERVEREIERKITKQRE